MKLSRINCLLLSVVSAKKLDDIQSIGELSCHKDLFMASYDLLLDPSRIDGVYANDNITEKLDIYLNKCHNDGMETEELPPCSLSLYVAARMLSQKISNNNEVSDMRQQLEKYVTACKTLEEKPLNQMNLDSKLMAEDAVPRSQPADISNSRVVPNVATKVQDQTKVYDRATMVRQERVQPVDNVVEEEAIRRSHPMEPSSATRVNSVEAKDHDQQAQIINYEQVRSVPEQRGKLVNNATKEEAVRKSSPVEMEQAHLGREVPNNADEQKIGVESSGKDLIRNEKGSLEDEISRSEDLVQSATRDSTDSSNKNANRNTPKETEESVELSCNKNLFVASYDLFLDPSRIDGVYANENITEKLEIYLSKCHNADMEAEELPPCSLPLYVAAKILSQKIINNGQVSDMRQELEKYVYKCQHLEEKPLNQMNLDSKLMAEDAVPRSQPADISNSRVVPNVATKVQDQTKVYDRATMVRQERVQPVDNVVEEEAIRRSHPMEPSSATRVNSVETGDQRQQPQTLKYEQVRSVPEQRGKLVNYATKEETVRKSSPVEVEQAHLGREVPNNADEQKIGVESSGKDLIRNKKGSLEEEIPRLEDLVQSEMRDFTVSRNESANEKDQIKVTEISKEIEESAEFTCNKNLFVASYDLFLDPSRIDGVYANDNITEKLDIYLNKCHNDGMETEELPPCSLSLYVAARMLSQKISNNNEVSDMRQQLEQYVNKCKHLEEMPRNQRKLGDIVTDFQNKSINDALFVAASKFIVRIPKVVAPAGQAEYVKFRKLKAELQNHLYSYQKAKENNIYYDLESHCSKGLFIAAYQLFLELKSLDEHIVGDQNFENAKNYLKIYLRNCSKMAVLDPKISEPGKSERKAKIPNIKNINVIPDGSADQHAENVYKARPGFLYPNVDQHAENIDNIPNINEGIPDVLNPNVDQHAENIDNIPNINEGSPDVLNPNVDQHAENIDNIPNINEGIPDVLNPNIDQHAENIDNIPNINEGSPGVLNQNLDQAAQGNLNENQAAQLIHDQDQDLNNENINVNQQNLNHGQGPNPAVGDLASERPFRHIKPVNEEKRKSRTISENSQAIKPKTVDLNSAAFITYFSIIIVVGALAVMSMVYVFKSRGVNSRS